MDRAGQPALPYVPEQASCFVRSQRQPVSFHPEHLPPALTQDKLPDIIHINKSNVTRALAHLEKRGFIRREVNPQDKRTAAVFPTQKALDVYPHVLEIIRGWDASVTSPLTEDEKHTLQALLKRVVASAHEYRSTES